MGRGIRRLRKEVSFHSGNQKLYILIPITKKPTKTPENYEHTARRSTNVILKTFEKYTFLVRLSL